MSGNPTLNQNTFSDARALPAAEPMTIQGAVNKTALLLLLTVISAAFTWRMCVAGQADAAAPLIIGGAIGGFIIALVTVFKQTWSPVTAPIYAVFEGLFMGGISAMFEAQFHGIVIQALMLTFGTLAGLLGLYKMGIIRATSGFVRGVMAATAGIALLYLATIILALFHVHIPAIYSSGPIGIGFSVLVVIVAALNLVIDFAFVEHGAESGAPKYMEWYAAFALMVTLIWLYLEILRLLAKLNRRS
jgi:uncharacterized YccA/Bax inhibitor family protein